MDTASTSAAQSESIIDASREAKAQVLPWDAAATNLRHPYTKVPAHLCRPVALQEDALVPFLFEGSPKMRGTFQSDRVHPTAEAQALMLDTIWTGVEPLLRR